MIKEVQEYLTHAERELKAKKSEIDAAEILKKTVQVMQEQLARVQPKPKEADNPDKYFIQNIMDRLAALERTIAQQTAGQGFQDQEDLKIQADGSNRKVTVVQQVTEESDEQYFLLLARENMVDQTESRRGSSEL
ncbi:unnamed protein product [Heligmosomoides polygyrus]|uniref:SKA2 domain-containing protein n=1 Tax=Heligmosomoides polygyrus TaxID=6339 RepID=A0A183F7A1_HELPZ|nr:unnamed protein product [Heligmosomoides polygyrus]